MRIAGKLVEGRFVTRDNRFRVTAEVGGREVWAHLPNSGRLGELLLPGRRVILVEKPAAGRKTGYDLSLVELDGRWISVDARLPNDLVEEALVAGRLEPLAGYPALRREVTYGRSRFDFLLEAPERPPCLVEVKSITLVVDGLGCFPDAVTLARAQARERAGPGRCRGLPGGRGLLSCSGTMRRACALTTSRTLISARRCAMPRRRVWRSMRTPAGSSLEVWRSLGVCRSISRLHERPALGGFPCGCLPTARVPGPTLP